MKLTPAAESERRILDTLKMHDEHESAMLDSYRQFVEEIDDPGVKFLGHMIMEDEERHHQLLREMESRIDSWLNHANPEAGTPTLSPHVDRDLLAKTRELIALERKDAKELRLLYRELASIPPTSLLPLLVKIMLHNTAKHIEMLRFVRSYTG